MTKKKPRNNITIAQCVSTQQYLSLGDAIDRDIGDKHYYQEVLFYCGEVGRATYKPVKLAMMKMKFNPSNIVKTHIGKDMQ